MKLRATLWPLAAGCAVVLLANGLLLAAAAWNRRGERRGEMTLTERELALPADHSAENTGLFLSLTLSQDPPEPVRRAAFRKRYELPRTSYAWLDGSKLRQLGFRIDHRQTPPQVGHEDHASPAPGLRRVFLVLELEGDAWARWLAAQGERVARLRQQVVDGTTLSGGSGGRGGRVGARPNDALAARSVDASTDQAALRSLYPDRARYVIVEGLISAGYARTEAGEIVVRGRIAGLVVDEVFVPKGLMACFDAFRRKPPEPEPPVAWPAPQAPRYQATLAVGRRNEPWIAEVH